jgi:transposase
VGGGARQASALQELARRSAAGHRALEARSAVVRTLAMLLLDLAARIAELDDLLAQLRRQDDTCQRLQQVPGVGPQNAATIRAERGDVARFACVDEVVAYAGLDPRTYHSGASGAYTGQRRLCTRGRRGCATPSTWQRSLRCASGPSGAPAMNACRRVAARRKRWW